MAVWEMLLLAAATAMDASAVALCKGAAMPRWRMRHSITIGLWFGGFQALMPLLGYHLGALVGDLVDSFDHWIVLLILCAIGIKTLREANEPDDEDAASDEVSEDDAQSDSSIITNSVAAQRGSVGVIQVKSTSAGANAAPPDTIPAKPTSAASNTNALLNPRVMFPLAIATSIDAFAVGVAIALRKTPMALPITLIGSITFILTAIGAWMGQRAGSRFGKTAERVGGVVLILLGVKALIDHFLS